MAHFLLGLQVAYILCILFPGAGREGSREWEFKFEFINCSYGTLKEFPFALDGLQMGYGCGNQSH